MNAELRVLSGQRSGEILPLCGSQFLIGRERDCHLRPDSELISRHHCVLRKDEFTLRIRDLGSRNGTFVNGQKITGEVVLQHGDTVFIGDMALEIRFDEPKMTPSNSADPTAHDTAHLSTGKTAIFEGNTAAASKKNHPQSAAATDAAQEAQLNPNETREA